MAAVLAIASGGNKANAQALPPPPAEVCSGDVVFFMDTSGSMCLGRLFSEPDPANAPLPDYGPVAGIMNAILALNAQVDRDFQFTVYYGGRDVVDPAPDEEGTALLDLFNLTVDDPNNPVDRYIPNLTVVRIEPSIVTNFPEPPCLTRGPLTSTFGAQECQLPPPPSFNCTPCSDDFGLQEDWGNALANVALYHPWRYAYDNCNVNYTRFYFPISDEGPRCGDECFFDPTPEPGDPLPDPVYGDPDSRSVADASKCAVVAGVRAMPIIGCCLVQSPEPTPPSIVDPTDPTAPPSCVTECVEALSSAMALLTTGNPDWYLNSYGWNEIEIADFIFDQVELHMCNRPSLICDSIDFNNDSLFPDDSDFVAFFEALAGQSCPTCNDIDFNNDCLFPDDNDLVSFLSVLAGGPCDPDGE